MTISVNKKHINATKITKHEDQENSIPSLLRLILHRGEVYRLPLTSGEIHVLSGHAWLSIASQDVVLSPGEQVSFVPHKVFGLVSVLGDDPLIFDIALASSK